MADRLVTYTVDDLVVILQLENRAAVFKRIKLGEIPKPAPIPGRHFLWYAPLIEAYRSNGMPGVAEFRPVVDPGLRETYAADDLVTILRLKDRETLFKRLQRQQIPEPASLAGRNYEWFAAVIEAFLLVGMDAATALHRHIGVNGPARRSRKRRKRDLPPTAGFSASDEPATTTQVRCGPGVDTAGEEGLHLNSGLEIATAPPVVNAMNASPRELGEFDNRRLGPDLPVVRSIDPAALPQTVRPSDGGNPPSAEPQPCVVKIEPKSSTPPQDAVADLITIQVTSTRGYPFTAGQRFVARVLFDLGGVVPDGPFGMRIPRRALGRYRAFTRNLGIQIEPMDT